MKIVNEHDEDTMTASSTIGIHSCGYLINFNIELKEYKTIFEIGKFRLQKYIRTKYFCSKCMEFV